MKLFLLKNAKFSSAGSSAHRPPCLQRLGASPPHTHWPPAAGGSAPRPPKQPPPLRISGYAPERFCSHLTPSGFVLPETCSVSSTGFSAIFVLTAEGFTKISLVSCTTWKSQEMSADSLKILYQSVLLSIFSFSSEARMFVIFFFRFRSEYLKKVLSQITSRGYGPFASFQSTILARGGLVHKPGGTQRNLIVRISVLAHKFRSGGPFPQKKASGAKS